MAKRPLLNRIWYRFMQRTLQLLCVMIYGLRRTGVRNVPAEGGVLLLPNHQSHLDPPLVGCCCSRRANFIARESLFDFAPFARLIRSLDAYPIDREGSGLAGIRETLRRLKRGEIVVIFPEGTRTPNGQIGPFRPGFTALAIRGRAAIVPVAIEGAFDAWPRWLKFPRRGRIHVHFGPPISADEVRSYNERELTAEIQRRVRRHHDQLRRHPDFAGRRKDGQMLADEAFRSS